MNVYFYPPYRKNTCNKAQNPYKENFINGLSNYCKVVNAESTASYEILDAYRFIFKFDTIIFNWIDNIANRRGSYFQFLLFNILLTILKLRKVKIVWILHNLHPHHGSNWMTDTIKKKLFLHSDLIIAHSYEAYEYASKNCSKKTNAFFAHHPNNIIQFKTDSVINILTPKLDLLIWGTIEPYKGIVEFLDFLKSTNQAKNLNNLSVRIIGRCKNLDYEKILIEKLSPNITYENRIISFEELKEVINYTRYILFPYNSGSISSSGALMDTLTLGGTVIGPHKGAFIDIERENLCFTFSNYNDILNILMTEKKISSEALNKFVNDNSWDSFCKKVYMEMKLQFHT